MKIKPEHVNHIHNTIKAHLDSLDTPAIIEAYESGNFPRSNVTNDLQLRFNWDCLHGAGLTPYICSTIYPYANDDHINTILKQVCPKVTRRY